MEKYMYKKLKGVKDNIIDHNDKDVIKKVLCSIFFFG